jgi:hypothetical protein
VLAEQRAAELRVGDASLIVRLVDQSATGFMIECDQHPGVYAGENVWLQTALGWTEAKVIKIRHEVDVTRIGLERLTDVNLAIPSSTGVIKGKALTHETPYSSPWPTIIMIGALLGVMSFLAWTAYDRHGSERFLDVIRGGHHDPHKSTAAAALEQQSQRRNKELQKSVKEFGVALMAMPEMAERLELSEEQLARLRQILREALASEQQLRGLGLAADELEKRLVGLHAEASQQATGLLNSQQGAAWRQMYAEAMERFETSPSPPAASPPANP